MMIGPRWVLLLGLAWLGQPQAAAAQDSTRYVFYLHGRIVEEGGRRPVSPEYGVYEYDAILDSLRSAGFAVLSEQRPPGVGLQVFVDRVVRQVDSLLQDGVAPERITVMGFSRGAAMALLASSRLANPRLNFVFMAGCGDWIFGMPEVRLTGRMLSLYEESDTLGVSCGPLFRNIGAGSERAEMQLRLGLGHGTFFRPRREWLAPALAWARPRARLPVGEVFLSREIDRPPVLLATPIRYYPRGYAGRPAEVVLQFVLDTLGHPVPGTARPVGTPESLLARAAELTLMRQRYSIGRTRGQKVHVLMDARIRIRTAPVPCGEAITFKGAEFCAESAAH